MMFHDGTPAQKWGGDIAWLNAMGCACRVMLWVAFHGRDYGGLQVFRVIWLRIYSLGLLRND